MANKIYKIKYLPTFISQFNNILYYITYELKNKIAADNLYDEVTKQIEIRSQNPESYEVFKKFENVNIKYLRLYLQIKYTILCCVLDFFYYQIKKHCRSPPSCSFQKLK